MRALAAATLFVPHAAPAPQDETPTRAEEDVFNRGRALFAKGQYGEAATVLKDNPQSFIADLLRPNLRADDVITTRHTLTYQDTNANSYTGQ